MENKEILEKAIQKAIDGGWNPYGFETNQRDAPWVSNMARVASSRRGRFELTDGYYYEIIFNHDFAKALWGKRTEIVRACSHQDCHYPMGHIDEGLDIEYCPYHGNKLEDEEAYVGKQPWRQHLQEMVIADDPIKYLGENIK